MVKATKLTSAERSEIEILLNKGHTLRAIGRALGRSLNTISDEVKRNKTPEGYNARIAKQKAYVKRKYAKYQGKKIQENDDLRWYIIVRLMDGWNPDEIAGRLKKDQHGYYASKTAIYEWLDSARGQKYCDYLPSRRYRPKKRKPKTDRVMIPDRVSITERPHEATVRSEVGHYEGDTIVSGKRTGSKAAIVVIQERVTRLIAARPIPDLCPVSFNGAISSSKLVLLSSAV